MTAELLFLGAVNASNGHAADELGRDLVQDGSKLLAVTTPRGVEFEQPQWIDSVLHGDIEIVASEGDDAGWDRLRDVGLGGK